MDSANLQKVSASSVSLSAVAIMNLFSLYQSDKQNK